MAEIAFTVTDRTAAYLRWLSRNIIPERTESQVARHLMMTAIEKMRREHGPPEPHSLDEMDTTQSTEEPADR